jgi:hypothetical protein
MLALNPSGPVGRLVDTAILSTYTVPTSASISLYVMLLPFGAMKAVKSRICPAVNGQPVDVAVEALALRLLIIQPVVLAVSLVIPKELFQVVGSAVIAAPVYAAAKPMNICEVLT